jgi:hypothetical protein
MDDDTTDNDDSDTDSDDLVVTVLPPFDDIVPVVEIAGGDQEANSGELVALDGSGSYDDNEILSYAWSLADSSDRNFINDISDLELTDPFAGATSFEAPVRGIGEEDLVLVLALTVEDDGQFTETGIANSTTKEVTITVLAEVDEDDPVAVILDGDRDVASEELVTLDGSGSSDADSDVTYAWTVLDDLVVLAGAGTATPTFIAPTVAAGEEAVDLNITLVVTDDFGNDDETEVTITVLAEDDTGAPVAVIAGETVRDVASGTEVALDGSDSTDNVGIVSYEWTVSPDDLVTLTGADTATPTFTAPFVAYGEDDVDLSVTLKVTDAEENEASATVRISVQAELDPDGPTVEETQTAIVNFMQARAGHVISAQPDLIGLLSGVNAREGNATVTQSTGAFNYATSNDQAVWGRVQGNWSTSGGAENSYYFGAIGQHINLTPDAIAGLMLEFDTLTQEDGTTNTTGSGYLVGPYFVAKSPNQPLFFEGRYLLGATSNTTSIDGAADQAFDTSRSLLQVKVAGQVVSNTTTLTPSLSFAHLTDTQGAFTDNYGREIDEQGIAVSNATFGLDFAKPILVQNGEMQLTGGFAGSWSASNNAGFASTITPDYEGGSASLHLGTVYALTNGVTFSGNMSYSGLLSDYQSLGLGAEFTRKF